MAVLTVSSLVVRPWAGALTVRHPSGVWSFTGVVTGDASGGEQTQQLNFPVGSMYSLEALTFDSNALADIACVLITGDGGLIHRWTVLQQQVTGTGRNSTQAHQQPGIVLGGLIWRPLPGTASTLSAIFANAAARTLDTGAWGWIWDPEAMRAGGALRP